MAPRLWGIWTRSKLELLDQYLDAFTTAAKFKSPEILYIDAFAGRPDNKDRVSGEKMHGSAETALRITDPPFTMLRFFEAPTVAAELDAHLRPLSDGRDCATLPGDSNVEVPAELSRLTALGLDWMPTFAFVDPNATEARWSLLKALAEFKGAKRYKAELFYLFSPQMFQRLLRTKAELVRDEDRQTISDVFGTDEWQVIYDAKLSGKISAAEATSEYLNLMRWRLQTVLGYRWTHPIEMKNEAGSPIYYMIFATDHDAGDRIMRHLFATAAAEHPRMREEARRLRSALDEAPKTLFEADELLALDAPIQEDERFYEHQPPVRPWWQEADEPHD